MIRPARPEDEPAVRACAELAYARYIPAMGRKPAPMEADYAAQIRAAEVHVHLSEEAELLGFAVMRDAGGRMLLENVAVLPAAAGRGVGKALIRFCEEEARRRGCEAVDLYTNAKMAENLSMYPRLGYVEVARRREDGFARVFFEKRLA